MLFDISIGDGSLRISTLQCFTVVVESIDFLLFELVGMYCAWVGDEIWDDKVDVFLDDYEQTW